MSSYSQFGNPDYGGFTTDEEIARRHIITSARGSPMIGAKMYMPTIPAVPAASAQPLYESSPSPQQPPQSPPQSLPQESAMTTRGGDIPISPPLSISEAFCQIFYSRPVTAFDWIIIFVMILVIISFFEYIRDSFVPQQHSYKGGNFCTLCGGAT